MTELLGRAGRRGARFGFEVPRRHGASSAPLSEAGSQKIGDGLEAGLIGSVESRLLVRVDVQNGAQLVALVEDRHHDLGTRVGIAGDVTRKGVDVVHDEGLPALGCGSANTVFEAYLEAPYRTLVGTDAQQAGLDNPVEAGPAGVWQESVHHGANARHGRDRVAQVSSQLGNLLEGRGVEVGLELL